LNPGAGILACRRKKFTKNFSNGKKSRRGSVSSLKSRSKPAWWPPLDLGNTADVNAFQAETLAQNLWRDIAGAAGRQKEARHSDLDR
jgi:hypothetical protein